MEVKREKSSPDLPKKRNCHLGDLLGELGGGANPGVKGRG